MMWKKIIPTLLLSPLYAVLGVFIYWAFLSITPAAFVVITNAYPTSVYADDNILVTYKAQWNRDCVYHITRTLVNENMRYNLGYVERFHAKSDPTSDTIEIHIPPNLTDGTYKLAFETHPICNFYDSIVQSTIPIEPIDIVINNNPIAPGTVSLANTTVKVNEPLDITTTFNRLRVCDANIDTFLTTEDGTIVQKYSRSSGALKPRGFQSVKELIPTTGLKPGNYILKRAIQDRCVEKIYQYNYIDLPFKVVKDSK